MSDSVENASFDLEAQQSLLVNPAAEARLCDVDDPETSNCSSNARKNNLLRTSILFFRSAEIFKLGANNYYSTDITSLSSSSTSPTYSSITTTPDLQGSGVVAALEISADEEDIIISAQSGYELQNIQQRKNITEIGKKKNLADLHKFGGVRGVAEALNTDIENGISSPREICQCKPTQIYQFLLTLFLSFLAACNNYTIFLLSCAAILSLGFGIKEEGMHFGWFNGAVLLSNVFIIVICTTIHKCWENLSNNKLENSWHSKGKKIPYVLTVRGDGDFQFVREIDLRVGDIVILRKGDQIPADGLFISSTGDQPLELDDGSVKSITMDENNPFLFYGSRVINGNAKMLVTSTHVDTVWGEMMSQAKLEHGENYCKFENYLHNLSMCVHITGLFLSILIIIVLFLRYEAGKLDDERRYKPESKGEPTRVKTITDAIIGIITGTKGTARVLTTLLSVSLLGIMEGMPLVISIAAIIWSAKTLAHKASERDYLACVKMASVTVICTDKFGGLTEKGKEIDKFYVGQEFVSESCVVASQVLEGLCDAIGTIFLIPQNDLCESALAPVISWAEAVLGMRRESVIEQCKMIDYKGHNPLEERCQVLMEKNGNGFLHCNGLPRDILSLCTHQYNINGEIQIIDEGKKQTLEKTIGHMLAEGAGVIAYACKHVKDFDDEASVEPNNLIFLAMISLKDTNIEDTKEAVSILMDGGIKTILTSADDVTVLETIGRNCGLIAPDSDDHLVLTGEEFRNLSDDEKMDKLDKICIMGNCIPSDKILLINCLRKKGHVVALLAQRTIDAPALKQADIGLTFGTWSSEVARECCDISIWDCNCFSFLVNVIKSGRCFRDNVRKFVQQQLIITISISLINFTAILSLGDAPITAVQLFWLNLVVALIGGLALLTAPCTKTTLLSTVPIESSAKMITKAMWRNIAIQASYQTTIFLTIQHKGHAMLGTIGGGRIKQIIYNGFFLCQLFNIFIAREPEKKNIFSGLFRSNRRFWAALVLFLVCQAVFSMAERVIGSSSGLNLKLWGVCLLIGLVSWLLDWAGKSASNFSAWWAEDDQCRIWIFNSITCPLTESEPTLRPFNLLRVS
ncbi:hypothetical protein DH2020_017177 [Rehmannia glutinosa]|uniref:Calcium-transporting ATPase n=1 Tax=Rehmannia glutinosa TaxID=99300 RepID=A0ABR0WTH4_REHGL